MDNLWLKVENIVVSEITINESCSLLYRVETIVAEGETAHQGGRYFLLPQCLQSVSAYLCALILFKTSVKKWCLILIYRGLDRGRFACSKILIRPSNPMLLVLKRIVSMRPFYWVQTS